jgi:hypothetical protein
MADKERKDSSMLIEKDVFEKMKQTLAKFNPELVNNEELIKDKIKDLDNEAKKLFAEWDKKPDQENQFRIALDILGQGRNFLALLVGMEQVDFLAGLPEKEAEKSPLETRHVAILVNNGKEVLVLSLKNALGVTAPESLRFKIYQNSKDLNDAILDGEICGIIGLDNDESPRVAGFLRHELKNRSGRDYRKSEEFILPPCANLSILRGELVVSLIKTIEKMQTGEFREQESEDFNLKDSLPELKVRMKTLKKPCQICIVDDRSEEILGMMVILKSWTGVELDILLYKWELDIRDDLDIILMDEDLGSNTTGTKMVQTLQPNSRALFASTTGGGTPGWCTPQRHFGLKSSVETNRDSAIAFVEFMNRLLESVDC